MSSKFNMKSKSSSNVIWSSKPYTQDYLDKEKAEADKIRKQYSDKKKEIESKNLEEVSFRDMYTFPFHQAKYGNWVYDADSNFIFQFEINNEETKMFRCY